MESQRANGWVLIPERFDDEGYSGATLDRPALDRLLADVGRGLVDQVVVHRLDRLSRSLRDCVKLLHEFRRVDVALVVVTSPELGYSAQDGFMLNILASFAEFEREMIAARIADTRARLKQRHLRFAGGVPFGYDADRRSKQLAPNMEESAVVKWMFAEAAAGRKPADIAEAANSLGHRTKVSVALRTGNKRGGNDRWWRRFAIQSISGCCEMVMALGSAAMRPSSAIRCSPMWRRGSTTGGPGRRERSSMGRFGR